MNNASEILKFVVHKLKKISLQKKQEMKSNPQLKKFIQPYDDDIQKLTLELRNFITDLLPQASFAALAAATALSTSSF